MSLNINKSSIGEKIYIRESEAIQQKYLKAQVSENISLVETIKKASEELKQIDAILTRSQIELHRYGHNTIPAMLWQSEIVAKFYFFVAMLGFIDARIDDANREISFLSNFFGKDDEKKEYQNLISKFLLDRKQIVDNYYSLEVDAPSRSFENVLNQLLNQYPSYSKFTELYNDASKHLYALLPQPQLVSAYNIGYINFYGDYDEKMNIYRELYVDLMNTKDMNKALLDKEKVKIKK